MDFTNNALCARVEGVMSLGESRDFSCGVPLFGDLISIQRTNPVGEPNAPLTLCEVKVYGNGK